MEITTPRFKLSDFLRNFFLLFAILLFFPNLPILYGLCEIAYRIPNLHNVQINWGFFICAKNKRFRYPIIQRPIILKLTDELCSMWCPRIKDSNSVISSRIPSSCCNPPPPTWVKRRMKSLKASTLHLMDCNWVINVRVVKFIMSKSRIRARPRRKISVRNSIPHFRHENQSLRIYQIT